MLHGAWLLTVPGDGGLNSLFFNSFEQKCSDSRHFAVIFQAFLLLIVFIMARKPRLVIENATYHITAKANRSEHIMQDDTFKELFMDVLKTAKEKFEFELVNLTIMGNHIHLMLKPGRKELLSKIMQWILSVFAIRYNKMNGLKGHVWYDRFKSKIINSVLQFTRTFIYISENPIKAGIARIYQEYFYNGINLMILERYKNLFTPPDEYTLKRLLMIMDKRNLKYI